MFIAMNRFKIKPGSEQDFIDIWKNRDSYLKDVPGFKQFNLSRVNLRRSTPCFRLMWYGNRVMLLRPGRNLKPFEKRMPMLVVVKTSLQGHQS